MASFGKHVFHKNEENGYFSGLKRVLFGRKRILNAYFNQKLQALMSARPNAYTGVSNLPFMSKITEHASNA